MSSRFSKLISTVFIDRDGVINRDSPDYIKSCDEFVFLPGVDEAFRLLAQNCMDAIIITNQSAVGRSMISLSILDDIFNKMKTGINDAGGNIRDIFFCPHHPDTGCNCRKPMPGMIHEAKNKYSLDLKASCMIGDSAKDIECAGNAGCGFSILVRTGNGLKAEAELKSKGIYPDYIADDLLDAVYWILKKDMTT